MLFSLSLAFTLCVAGACTQALFPYLRALCYCFGACRSLLPCFPLLFVLCSCVWWAFRRPRQTVAQNHGGVSEVGKIDFFIVLLVFYVVFLFLLFISLARTRLAFSVSKVQKGNSLV